MNQIKKLNIGGLFYLKWDLLVGVDFSFITSSVSLDMKPTWELIVSTDSSNFEISLVASGLMTIFTIFFQTSITEVSDIVLSFLAFMISLATVSYLYFFPKHVTTKSWTLLFFCFVPTTNKNICILELNVLLRMPFQLTGNYIIAEVFNIHKTLT